MAKACVLALACLVVAGVCVGVNAADGPGGGLIGLHQFGEHQEAWGIQGAWVKQLRLFNNETAVNLHYQAPCTALPVHWHPHDQLHLMINGTKTIKVLALGLVNSTTLGPYSEGVNLTVETGMYVVPANAPHIEENNRCVGTYFYNIMDDLVPGELYFFPATMLVTWAGENSLKASLPGQNITEASPYTGHYVELPECLARCGIASDANPTEKKFNANDPIHQATPVAGDEDIAG